MCTIVCLSQTDTTVRTVTDKVLSHGGVCIFDRDVVLRCSGQGSHDVTCVCIYTRQWWNFVTLMVILLLLCCPAGASCWWRERADTSGPMGELDGVTWISLFRWDNVYEGMMPFLPLFCWSKAALIFLLSLLRITPRKFDMVPTCVPQSPAHTAPDLRTHSSLTLCKRGTRTSFTFRKIRHEPCRCGENPDRLLPAAP